MTIPDKKVLIDFLEFLLKQKEENSSCSYIAIKNAMNLFLIPFGCIRIPKGTAVFRIRPHEKENLFFEQIQEIAHISNRNKILKFGRANEPLQSMFYCSTTRETAFFETSKIVREKRNLDCEVLTIGKWILQEDIWVANLPLNTLNKGQNSIADNIHLNFEQLVEKYKNLETDNLLNVLELFSIEFSKEFTGNDCDYMISCAFANYVYENEGIDLVTKKPIKVSGIIYPSVQWNQNG